MQSNSFFLYGSLRLGFKSQAFSYVTKFFRKEGEGRVKGKIYFDGKVPVAKHTEDEQYINGEVYTLNNPEDFNWASSQLDDYEGLNVEPGEEPLYKRELVKVYMDGKTMEAWAYWYNRSVSNMKELDADALNAYLNKKSE